MYTRLSGKSGVVVGAILVLLGAAALGWAYFRYVWPRTFAPPVAVTIAVEPFVAGTISLGTGWATWDHARWTEDSHKLAWTDEQWASYLNLLKASGADWLRLDLYYGDTEPRNDNADPEVINWTAFTFDNPRLKDLYSHLDFAQANNIDVYLVYTYAISVNDYNHDPESGWMSKELVERQYPAPITGRPPTDLIDNRELAENLAATLYHLLVRRGYTSIKQVALYVEPNWVPSLDGFRDTIFLGRLLRGLGIRDRVKILAPHIGSSYLTIRPGDERFPPPSDFDIYAVEDYVAYVNWQTGELRESALRSDVLALKAKNPSWDAALVEYGNLQAWRATDAMPSYLRTLSSACLLFELYNAGFAGAMRWSFEPFYHPYDGWGVYKVKDLSYPPAAPPPPVEVDTNTIAAAAKAIAAGATFVKVPHTFEPQRLLNQNLQRGSTVYRLETSAKAPRFWLHSTGVFAVAVKDRAGRWRVGLANPHPVAVPVNVIFRSPDRPLRQLTWEYYDATLPDETALGPPRQLLNGTFNATLSPRSLNFFREPE